MSNIFVPNTEAKNEKDKFSFLAKSMILFQSHALEETYKHLTDDSKEVSTFQNRSFLLSHLGP